MKEQYEKFVGEGSFFLFPSLNVSIKKPIYNITCYIIPKSFKKIENKEDR